MADAHPRRRGPRRTLSEQVILDAALAVLAELGADRITIRGIATRVGIAPNAVYTYFPDKAAVLHGLIEQLLGRVGDRRFTDPTLPWRDRVHAVAHALRTELLAHPGSAHLLHVHTLGSVALTSTEPMAAGDQFRWGLDRLLDGLTTYVLDDKERQRLTPG